jgi:hypothetical protein
MSSLLGKAVLLLTIASPALWYGYGAALEASMPRVEIRELSPLATQGAKTLPFFELMSPLPELAGAEILPKLEYKKGPPDRFLERISVLIEKDPASPKERIIYYGRRTRTDLHGLGLLADDPAREARYVEIALRISQGGTASELSGLSGFLFRPFFLREASNLLSGVESVAIMDQAGTPAFLFESPRGENGRARASALFVRRSGFYRVDYLGDRGFAVLDPEALFRKSFLTEKRADALEYIARNLSEVRLEPSQRSGLKLSEVASTLLLLAANVSVDPASIDTYFHFAGINALLYRTTSASSEPQDLEVTDTLRNNVLSSDLYAQDVAPGSPKSTEIARFARLLTRNFDQ